jgi:5-methylcytosine-specific restriction enzyme A
MPKRVSTHRSHAAIRTREQAIADAPQKRRDYRASPERRPLEAFYNSKRWRSLSAAFKRDNPLCSACEAEGRTTAADQVHHLKPIAEHPAHAFDWSNLTSLCLACHNRAHGKTAWGRRVSP